MNADYTFTDPCKLIVPVRGGNKPFLSWAQATQLKYWLTTLAGKLGAYDKLKGRLENYAEDVADLIAKAYPTANDGTIPEYITKELSPNQNSLLSAVSTLSGDFMTNLTDSIIGPDSIAPIIPDDKAPDYINCGVTHMLFTLMNSTCKPVGNIFVNALQKTYDNLIGKINDKTQKRIAQKVLDHATGVNTGIFLDKLYIIVPDGDNNSANPLPFANSIHEMPTGNGHQYGILPLDPNVVPSDIQQLSDDAYAYTVILPDDVWLYNSAEKSYTVKLTFHFPLAFDMTLIHEYRSEDVVKITKLSELSCTWIWPAVCNSSIKNYYVFNYQSSGAIYTLEPINASTTNSRVQENLGRTVWKQDKYSWMMKFMDATTGRACGVVCVWQQGADGNLQMPQSQFASTNNSMDCSVDFGSTASVVRMKAGGNVLPFEVKLRDNPALLSRRIMSNDNPAASGAALQMFMPEMSMPNTSNADKAAYDAMLNNIPSSVIQYTLNTTRNPEPLLDYNIFYDNVNQSIPGLGTVVVDLKYTEKKTAKKNYMKMLVVLCCMDAIAHGGEDANISQWRLAYPSFIKDGATNLTEQWSAAIKEISEMFNIALMEGTINVWTEAQATAKYFISGNCVGTDKTLCSVDVGGSTSDIAFYNKVSEPGEEPKLISSFSLKFAGRAILINELARLPEYLAAVLGQLTMPLSKGSKQLDLLRKDNPALCHPYNEVLQIYNDKEKCGKDRENGIDTAQREVEICFAIENTLRWYNDQELINLVGKNLTAALADAHSSMSGNLYENKYKKFRQDIRFKLVTLYFLIGYVYRHTVKGGMAEQLVVGGNGSRIIYWADNSAVRVIPGGNGFLELNPETDAHKVLCAAVNNMPIEPTDKEPNDLDKVVMSMHPKQEVASGLSVLNVENVDHNAPDGSLETDEIKPDEWLDDFAAWLEHNSRSGSWLEPQPNITERWYMVINAAHNAKDVNSNITNVLNRIETLLG